MTNGQAIYGDAPATFGAFVEGADRHFHHMRLASSDYRIGQAYMNYFSWHFSHESSRIVATGTDPYYRDSALATFLAYVRECGAVSA